jgi:hypothetical protein
LICVKSLQPAGNAGVSFSNLFCGNKKAPQVGRFERESEWQKFTTKAIKVKGNSDEETGLKTGQYGALLAGIARRINWPTSFGGFALGQVAYVWEFDARAEVEP